MGFTSPVYSAKWKTVVAFRMAFCILDLPFRQEAHWHERNKPYRVWWCYCVNNYRYCLELTPTTSTFSLVGNKILRMCRLCMQGEPMKKKRTCENVHLTLQGPSHFFRLGQFKFQSVDSLSTKFYLPESVCIIFIFCAKCAPNIVHFIQHTIALFVQNCQGLSHIPYLGFAWSFLCDCCLQFTYWLRIAFIRGVPTDKIGWDGWNVVVAMPSQHQTFWLPSSNRSPSQAVEIFDV